MLRIAMSSIMRRRSGVILFGHRGTPVAGLHKRAIFSDRIGCDEHFPIVSHSQASRNGDGTKRLRGREAESGVSFAVGM
jgi:hypothetical protein